jgi:Predicted RNA-binding protein
MKQELVTTGKTVEAAVAAAADNFGVDISKVEYEVLENPKKGFLGFGETLAKVRASYTPPPEQNALTFVRKLLTVMELDAHAELSEPESGTRDRAISVTGENAGILIGHHGDTLDSLQYLVNLAANKREEDDGHGYTRITVDVENYRAKREETLRTLARRMASKVLRYGKSVTLEPMNPYERRIIHSEVQNIEGVTTVSIGVENNRRVVISPDDKSSSAAKPGAGKYAPRRPRFSGSSSDDE